MPLCLKWAATPPQVDAPGKLHHIGGSGGIIGHIAHMGIATRARAVDKANTHFPLTPHPTDEGGLTRVARELELLVAWPDSTSATAD